MAACTELETHLLDWLVDMLGLPGRYALRMAIAGTWTQRGQVEAAWRRMVENASDLES